VNEWTDVVAAALVGTDRRPAPAGPTGLLDAAGLYGLLRRAGVHSETGLDLPDAAPAEAAPLASVTAATRLAGLLGPLTGLVGTDHWNPDRLNADTRLELLNEWLEAGRLVPGEVLPALLDLGRRHRRLRPALLAAGGERIRWLAAQRADWRYLLGENDERELTEPWDLAPAGRRIGHLRAVRRRDPAAGRALLESTWDTERPDDRAALLGALVVGLSTADEDMLDKALDDRRREVRGTAFDLLARLPETRYARRMAARARECLRIGSDGVEVHPPSECDASMQRDGVAPRPPAGSGHRAWWLEEVLARTPVTTWGTPADLLDLPMDEDWVGVVRRGLGRAAATQANGEWAAALVDRLWPEAAIAQRPDDRLLLEALYEAIPVEQRAGRAAAVLRADPGRAPGVGVERLLDLCPRPWSADLGDAVLFALTELLLGGASTWRLSGLVGLAGTRLPLSTVDSVGALHARIADERPDDPRLAVTEQLTEVLRFRREMHEELDS
jgi:hypothetical protein